MSALECRGSYVSLLCGHSMRVFQVCFEGKDPLDRQLTVCVLKKTIFHLND